MKKLIAIILAGVVSACASLPEGTPTTLTPHQRATVERSTRNHLKDPNSAMFGAMAASTWPDGYRKWVCGMVNAKNSFGGYVGMKPFIGVLHTDDIFELRSIAQSEGDILGLQAVCRHVGAPVL